MRADACAEHNDRRLDVITRIPLDSGWSVRAVGGDVPSELRGVTFPATVPGCVHLDLLAAGLIPDPLLERNEALAQWPGAVEWCYETDIDAPHAIGGDDHVDLVALGLDTVATVELNDDVVGRTANMHRSYRFPIARTLDRRSNRLRVTFASAIAEAERMSERLGPRPRTVAAPINAIRKMACNFGADWGPELVTAGIWRPIRLETWNVARLAEVRPVTEVDAGTGVLHTHVRLERDPHPDLPLEVTVSVAGLDTTVTLRPEESEVTVTVRIPNARLWWPAGYGEQHLYSMRVVLADGEKTLDTWQHRVGFRSVVLDTGEDERGTAFTLNVNGTRVFARGVNWIPDDPFPARVRPEDYAQRLGQARDANANLVRVWGGGIYEDDAFYDRCDELGLLVWQDFMFNCACYAEEEPLRGEIVAEAREAVTRLGRHASLALWNGCNENLWGHEDWDWKRPLAGRTWGLGYYVDVLPGIVTELDPGRAYSPGSPCSPTLGLHPNDPAHGTMHIWDVWNQRGYEAYRDYVPRFAAEFGFQAPPCRATLARAISDRPLTPDSPGMRAHQKANDGLAKLNRGLRGHLPQPELFDDWHWATSLNQARAIAYAVEHFRSWMPVCMGTIVWQLNDCWPVTSWSAVDGDGRPKPLWYALRHSYRDRLLTLQPRNGGLALVAVNDCDETWIDTVNVSRRDLSGTVLARADVSLALSPRTAATAPLPGAISAARDPARELVVAESGPNRAWWHCAEDIDAALPPPELDSTVEVSDGGYRLTVTAHTVVRDLAVLADRLAPDAAVDDMLITLLPGETAVFSISTDAALPPAALTDPLVLRSANQLVNRT